MFPHWKFKPMLSIEPVMTTKEWKALTKFYSELFKAILKVSNDRLETDKYFIQTMYYRISRIID